MATEGETAKIPSSSKMGMSKKGGGKVFSRREEVRAKLKTQGQVPKLEHHVFATAGENHHRTVTFSDVKERVTNPLTRQFKGGQHNWKRAEVLKTSDASAVIPDPPVPESLTTETPTTADKLVFQEAVKRTNAERETFCNNLTVVSVSFNKNDVFCPINKNPSTKTLQSAAGPLHVAGGGYVKWLVKGNNGLLRPLVTKAFLVPKCNVRLLSTSATLTNYPEENFIITKDELVLSGIDGDSDRCAVTPPLHLVAKLPVLEGHSTPASFHVSSAPCFSAAMVSSIDDCNINLNAAEKELLRWHYRLGHLSFAKIQSLLRSGVLCHSTSSRSLHAAASRIKTPPKCAACLFGKQRTRPTKATRTTVVKNKASVTRQGNPFPGQEVSVDHFVCSTKGRLFTSRGKTRDEDMYFGGCVFIDHSSVFFSHCATNLSL